MLVEPFNVTVPPVPGFLSNAIERFGKGAKFACNVAVPAPGVKVVSASFALPIVPCPVIVHPLNLKPASGVAARGTATPCLSCWGLVVTPFNLAVPPVVCVSDMLRFGKGVNTARTVALPVPGVKVVLALFGAATVPDPSTSHLVKL